MGLTEQYGEHTDKGRYQRYHRDVFMPDHVRDAAFEFLPESGKVLELSEHYKIILPLRGLAEYVEMPKQFSLIDVTVVRATQVIYRVMVRAPCWTRRSDFCIVLDGDYGLVTGFWISRGDQHPTLDRSVYEQEEEGREDESLPD